jgi:F-type H+-transporting ATPase subunit b
MRPRTAIAALAVVFAVVLGTTSMATAETEPATGTKTEGVTTAQEPAAGEGHVDVSKLTDANKEIFECVETEQVKATPDFVSCAKAPSPILPAQNELIWGTLAFFIVLGAIVKVGYPALKKGMDGRTERIRADLARADDAKAEAEASAAEYQQRLAQAKSEATRIIEDARGAADNLKAELQKRAEADIAEMRQRAQAEIEASKGQAMADLKGEVAQLAIRAAEMVVEKSLDNATQVQLIENYIASVGSQN